VLLEEYDIDDGGSLDFAEFLVLVYKVRCNSSNVSHEAFEGLQRFLNEAKAQLHVFEVSLH
jgi:hypothetical protein